MPRSLGHDGPRRRRSCPRRPVRSARDRCRSPRSSAASSSPCPARARRRHRDAARRRSRQGRRRLRRPRASRAGAAHWRHAERPFGVPPLGCVRRAFRGGGWIRGAGVAAARWCCRAHRRRHPSAGSAPPYAVLMPDATDLPNAAIDPSDDERSKEVERRLGLVRQALDSRGADAVLFRLRHNFAWLTVGGDNHILSATETGATFLLVTATDAFVVAPNNEEARIRDEEVAGLPLQIETFPWHEPGAADALARSRSTGRVATEAE